MASTASRLTQTSPLPPPSDADIQEAVLPRPTKPPARLTLASTSLGHITHTAVHHSPASRTLIIVHTSGKTVSVLGGDHELQQSLSFAGDVEGKGIGALCVGEDAVVDSSPLILASLGTCITAWSRTPVGAWRRHSAFSHDARVTSLALQQGQLLVGAEDSISLWSLTKDSLTPWKQTWRRKSPAAIHTAAFSPARDAFAAFTQGDTRVLLWALPRFGVPQLKAQLQHARPLLGFQWREPPDRNGQLEALLTTTADGTIRLWAPVIDEPGIPRQWAAICPWSCGGGVPHYLSAAHVSAALQATVAAFARQAELAAVGLRTSSKREDEAREGAVRRLEAVAEAPDLFLAVQNGELVIKALANVDRAPPTLHGIYTVLSVPTTLPDGPAMLLPLPPARDAAPTASAALLLVGHASYELAPALFFEGAPGGLRARMPSGCPPHSHAISRFITAPGRRRAVSVAAGESRIWTPHLWKGGKRALLCQEALVDCVALGSGDASASWDGVALSVRRNGTAKSYQLPRGTQVSIVLLPPSSGALLVTPDASILSVETQAEPHRLATSANPSLIFALDAAVDAAPQIGTITASGHLEMWELRTTWTRCAHVETGVRDAALAKGAENGFVALASGLQLSIWDTRASAFSSGHEHAQAWGSGISALAWAPEPSAPLLAVASADAVSLLAPRRPDVFDDLRQLGAERWDVLARVELGRLSCDPIADVTWLANSQLLIATANQVHAFGPTLNADAAASEEEPSRPRYIAELVAARTGPLADYHPMMLLQVLLWGKLETAKVIVVALAKACRASSGDEPVRPAPLPFEAFLGDGASSGPIKRAAHLVFDDEASEQADDTFSEKLTAQLLQDLSHCRLEGLDAAEQAHLRVLVQTVQQVDEQRRALDDNGLRFLVALQSFVLAAPRQHAAPRRLKYRDVLWAYHSSSQELLQGALFSAYEGQLTWEAARASGVFMWLRSPTALREVAESVARTQYQGTAAGADRDPVACSLLYYALGKHKLVQGLWRQATGHPEQRKMLTFLSNDFGLERWRTAALKNAFALLSQRRFTFAAVFFMLGGSLRDAVNVCVRNLGDLQLGLALARLHEGRDDGPVLTDLLRTRVLPLAFEQGYRWLGSWAFWVLNRRDLAVRVILTPFKVLASDPDVASLLPPSSPCGDGHYADASLAILFAQLKHKSLQTLRGTSAISDAAERAFVLHINRVLWRQGCGVLGLALLRSWEFDKVDVRAPLVLESEGKPTQLSAQAAAEADTVSALFGTSPTRTRAGSRRDSGDGEPISPGVMARRRSSLMRRRSTIIDDLALVSPGAASVSAPPFSPAPATVTEEPKEIAQPQPQAPQEAKQETKLPPKGVPTMLKATTSQSAQGAQEFSFDSFGF